MLTADLLIRLLLSVVAVDAIFLRGRTHILVVVLRRYMVQVYVKAKECSEVVSVEEFAIILGKHFTTFYPQVVAPLFL